jgi:beta-phosphoglucomutase
MDESEILPDVIKVLDYLKDLRIPMALGSASKNARPILEKVKLLTYFDVIVDGNSVTKAKPDPEVFMIAAKNLGIAPRNCVVFEDAQAGIAAANAAGMISIGIGQAHVLSEAHFNFENFVQINIDFLNTLIAKLKNR